MAVVLQNDKDKDKEGQPSTIASAPITTGAGGAPASTASNQPRPASSGQFTNLSNYLRANQPGQFGQKVATGVTQQGEKAKSTLGTQQNKFGQGIEQNKSYIQGSTQLGTNLINQAQDIGFGKAQPFMANAAPLQQPGQPGQVAPANANPVSDVKQAAPAPSVDDQIGEFQKFIGGSYSGPQGLEDPMKVLAQARVAQAYGNLAGSNSAADKGALLSNMYARPTYSAGQRGLDTLFLSQGQAPGQLRQAAQGTRGLEQKFGGDISLAEKQAAIQAQADAAARGEVKGTLKSTYESGMGEAKSAQQKAISDAQDYARRLREGFASGQIGSPDYEKFGVKAGDIVSAGDLNIGEAANVNWNDLNDIGKVASKEQSARLLGLAKLAGNVAPDLDARGFALDKAGTAQGLTYDQDRVRQIQSTINQRVADAQAKLKANSQANYISPDIKSVGAKTSAVGLRRNQSLDENKIKELANDPNQLEGYDDNVKNIVRNYKQAADYLGSVRRVG